MNYKLPLVIYCSKRDIFVWVVNRNIQISDMILSLALTVCGACTIFTETQTPGCGFDEHTNTMPQFLCGRTTVNMLSVLVSYHLC